MGGFGQFLKYLYCFNFLLFKIVDERIKLYSQNTNLLPSQPKSTFLHLQHGIQTLTQELSGTKYKEVSAEENSVVNDHSTTQLPKLLTSCLTAVKTHVIRYCEKIYERPGKNFFWFIKNSGEVINKRQLREFRATSLTRKT